MRFSTLIATATLVLSASTALARDIMALTAEKIANGGQAPGSPTNYDFGDFGHGGQPTDLTDFLVSTAGDSQYPGNGNYTTVIAPGGVTPFRTAIAYIPPHIARTQAVATFRPTFDGDFTVWILDANTDGNAVGNTSVGLGVNGGAEVSTPTVYNGINEFTPFYVTGATTSDLFQVYATSSTNNYPSLGGLTFSLGSESATPEPGNLALCTGLGITGSVFLRRRKRAL